MKKTLMTILMLTAILFSFTVFAKPLNLYQKPNLKAKVVAKMYAGEQLVPIYFPKKSDWVKVANPKNGEVGWVKFADIEGKSSLPNAEGFSWKQKVVVDKKDKNAKPKVYRVVEYDGSKPIKPEQIKKIVGDMQKQMEQIQIYMQQFTQSMLQQFNKTQEVGMKELNDTLNQFPASQESIVVPDQYKK